MRVNRIYYIHLRTHAILASLYIQATLYIFEEDSFHFAKALIAQTTRRSNDKKKIYAHHS